MTRAVDQIASRAFRLAHEYQAPGIDHFRFPAGIGGGSVRRLKRAILAVAHRLGFHYQPAPGAAERLSTLLAKAEALQQTHDWLEDDESRQLLIELLAYRVVGGFATRQRRDGEAWRAANHQVAKHRLRANVRRIGGMQLDRYQISGITMEVHAGNVRDSYLLEQYCFRRGGVTIGARPGDAVVDGGACWGDTALYFANRTGPSGSVVAFEFVPENLAVLRDNLAANPELAKRISLREAALWSRGGLQLSFEGSGPGTRVSLNQGGVPTRAIDQEQRVDFIKLDVEGAELETLRGAHDTIVRDGPDLAISVYHRPEDLMTIPQLIKELRPAYRLHLDHFTVHGEESVLFATCR
jgi:FkbM family methyltransferase